MIYSKNICEEAFQFPLVIIVWLQVKGRDVGFQTTKEGEFWRILLPGIYTMEVFAEGYRPREIQFAIVEQNPTLLNITLVADLHSAASAGVGAGLLGNHIEKVGTVLYGHKCST